MQLHYNVLEHNRNVIDRINWQARNMDNPIPIPIRPCIQLSIKAGSTFALKLN